MSEVRPTTQARATRAERSWTVPVSFTVSAVLILGGVFAPWLRSGASTRSSFELFDLVERLGFAPDGAFAWAVRLWPLVPLATIGGVVAVWAGRRRLSIGLAGATGCYVTAVAVGLRQAPNAGLIRTEWGVDLALAGAVAGVLSACWAAIDLRRARGRAPRTPA